jgi:hypothetical protein
VHWNIHSLVAFLWVTYKSNFARLKAKTYVDLRQLNHTRYWESTARRRSWEFLWKYKNYIFIPVCISTCKLSYFVRNFSLISSIKSLNLTQNIQWLVLQLLATPLVTPPTPPQQKLEIFAFKIENFVTHSK